MLTKARDLLREYSEIGSQEKQYHSSGLGEGLESAKVQSSEPEGDKPGHLWPIHRASFRDWVTSVTTLDLESILQPTNTVN